MISVEKDLNGKYRCMKCHKLTFLHEKFHFICDCNKEEVQEYENEKFRRLRERLFENSKYIL
jgi:hypothetical protein